MSKLVKLIIFIIVVLIIVLALYGYWQHQKKYPSTNDAYVQANIVQIAPQVSGKVAKVAVKENQAVKKGQLLFSIDPRSFQYALTQAQAQLELSKQTIDADQDNVAIAEATIKQRQAEEIVAQQNYDRTMKLVKADQATPSQGDDVTSKLSAAKAALAAAQSQLEQAKATLGKLGDDNANLKLAQAKVDVAKLNLQHTQIYAPADGVITHMKLRHGDMVTAGQMVFSFVESDYWWVNANFKETHLNRIRPGQPATVNIDIYPDHTFTGTVQSLSRGSGASFSILPPENATGNWVKVTQRFPVRIALPPQNPHYPLRVGASCSVTVDTTKS